MKRISKKRERTGSVFEANLDCYYEQVIFSVVSHNERCKAKLLNPFFNLSFLFSGLLLRCLRDIHRQFKHFCERSQQISAGRHTFRSNIYQRIFSLELSFFLKKRKIGTQFFPLV